MNIEQKIRNNRDAFDDMKMPEGSRERFQKKLEEISPLASLGRNDEKHARNDKRLWLTWAPSAAAAAITAFVMIAGLKFKVADPLPEPQTTDSEMIAMRQFYDEKVEEAIINLEEVMENVDDSTKMQINAVIRDLMNMGDVFAEMAPLPEERQMAIAEQMYDNKLRAFELITDRINK